MLKIILASVILVALSMAGLGLRMLFDRKAEFRGGSCSASADPNDPNTYSCACNGTCEVDR